MTDRLARVVASIATALFIYALFTVDGRSASFVEGGGPHPSPLASDPQAYAAFYGSFVPTACCFTSQCCYEIDDDDVEDLGSNSFRIKASGQIVERKGYSPDGKYHRCSCDYHDTGWWKIWPGANTRCLFTPSFGS
jgi:hypothetical protein